LFFCNEAFAQNATNYELPMAEKKIENSRYKSLKCLDSRSDTTFMGIVQTGFFNKKTRVVSKKPLAVQVEDVFRSLIDEQAKTGELLLQIRDFGFAERTAGMSETGYCFFRADLYARVSDSYFKIKRIDTVVTLRSGIDVTADLLTAGAEIIKAFISNNLFTEASTIEPFSYADILHIDDYEKRKIKLYNTETYTEGLYTTYQSFKDQTPDKQIIVEGDYLYNGLVKTKDDKGKLQKVTGGKIYAIVFRGKPYIASKEEYYPLAKVNDEFVFTGKANASSGSGAAVVAGSFGLIGGLVGGLISANNESTFEIRIDHVTGSFIKLKEVQP